MPGLPSAYRGPAVVIGLGTSFVAVGSVPVAITLGMGTKSSATVIGGGFIAFGLFMILPGIFWCLYAQHRTIKYWRRRRSLAKLEEKSSLNGKGKHGLGGMEAEFEEGSEQEEVQGSQIIASR